MTEEKINIEETDYEKELLDKIKEALVYQAEKEKNFYSSLKAPEYHRPGYKFWWIFAPIGLVITALVILLLLPTSYPSLNTIDSQITEVEEGINQLESTTYSQRDDLNDMLEQIDKTINLLQEEKNG